MIINKTSGKVICKKSKILTTITQKAIGLMFHKKIKDIGYIFVFDRPQIVGLHMFFVFFPIDVLFLDSKKTVIDIKKNFKPFRLYTSKGKSSYVLELPEGSTNNIHLGDMIILDKSK